MSALKIISGLGNPGEKYKNNRHNAGLWFIDMLAEKYDAQFVYQKKLSGHVSKIHMAESSIQLFRPDTFMNQSGQAIQKLLHYYQVEPQEILVAHDEIDFPVAQIRLKNAGGHGGHNGLRSIISHIGDGFWRLRIGVGHPGHKDQVTSYVLGDASQNETMEIGAALNQLDHKMEQLAQGNFEIVMDYLHRQDQ